MKTLVRNCRVRNRAGATIYIDVEVDLDVDTLGRDYAWKVIRNKSSRTSQLGGRVKIRQVGVARLGGNQS